MRNKKKKVIASMLAVSMTISSVPATTFADGGQTIVQTKLNSSVPATTYAEKVLKTVQEDLKPLLSKWFLNSYDTANKLKLIDMSTRLLDAIKKQKYLSTPYTEQEIDGIIKRVENITPASSSGGIWAWVKNNILSSPFVGTFIAFQLVDVVRDYYKNLKTKHAAGKVEKPIDPIATMEILDILMSTVKGQENAKRQIRRAVLNIVDKNSQFLANGRRSKKAGPGASVIYMVGPSGVGKSFSAEIIRKVLGGFNAEPFVIEASDIDKQSKSSAVEQLFGMKIKRMNNSEIYEYSPFIQRIKSIPNTVVVINEYDKMHTPELDEKLRTIMDQGYINVNGEKIDCSGATFIITSNESSGSVKKGNNEVDNVDDGTGSRTFINHDKAFLNRIKLIEFDNLSAEYYEEIAVPHFTELANRYKTQYGVTLDFNGTIKEVAKRVEDLNKGARPIFDYIELLNNKLLDEVVLKNLKSGNNNVEYKVSLKNDDFILEEKAH